MPEIERLGKDPLTQRDLYFLNTKSLDDIAGRVRPLIAVGEDQSRCCQIERKPQHRRDQENCRE